MLFASVTTTIPKQLDILLLTKLLVKLVDIRSFFVVHYTDEIPIGYRLSIIAACITLVMLAILIHEERGAPTQPIISDTERPMSTEMWASIYSKFMFNWIAPMMREGYQRTLNEDDLIELLPQNRAKNVLVQYKAYKSRSIFWSILRSYKREFMVQFIYAMAWNAGLFGPAIFLNKIVTYIDDPHPEKPVIVAYFYVFMLGMSSAVQTLSAQQALYIGRTLGVRIQAIVVGEVFAKALRKREHPSSSTDDDESCTNVNNLLSVDSLKISDFMAYLFQMYSYALQIILCIGLLWMLLGVAAFWGVCVMIVMQPFAVAIGRLFERNQKKVMSATDHRIKKVNELLGAIRSVKFFAWEKEFKARVMDAREKELKWLRRRLYIHMHTMNLWFFIPILIMITVFYAYTRTYELTAATAFTTVALFNLLRTALDMLPDYITQMLQARVSAKRIQDFLKEEEVSESPSFQSVTNIHVGFVNNATFGWENDPNKAIIKDLNLSFPRGKLSVVCGPTGSGKSTLLASLLGETHCFQGGARLARDETRDKDAVEGGAPSGVAYVAQTAWIQNKSIRDNILFGLPYDADRYEQVLYMTALTKDLEIFEHGDSTEVGEKGVTLSGGQKQRVAIARAVYSQADTILLDDCLSAVDAHTAKHLYEHLTHYVALCLGGASYIVVLKDGHVTGAGDPSQIMQSGILGEEIANKHQEITSISKQQKDEELSHTIPKKTVQYERKEGAGKLVKEEERAEGHVPWSVYKAYVEASGGTICWIVILSAFLLTQGAIFCQDYWIKIWTNAYELKNDTMENNAMETTQQAPTVNATYYLGIYALIGFCTIIASTMRSLILYTVSIQASRRLHEKLLHKILRARIRFFDTTPIGRVINRFSMDMQTIDQDVSPQIAFVLITLVSTLTVILLVTIVLPLFIIPGTMIAIAFTLIGMYYLATSRDLKRLNSVSRSPIYVQFSESIHGVATIRAFGAQARFLNENYTLVDNNNRPFLWMWASNRWLHARIELLGVFVSFWSGFAIVYARDWIDPGLAGLCLSNTLLFTGHVLWLVRGYAQNEMNMNSIERIQEYMDIEEEAPENIPATCPPKSWPETGTVKIDDLEMRYSPDGPAVLHRISFETKPREKVGIVGRTGSGKSTLALSIFRFMEASHGRILIDNVDIATLGLEDLRSRLTIIPQDPILFSGTLRSNLDPFGQHDDAELWAALKR
ncbi:hypothetical protein K492DRAFT_217842, partial [Lichtheimia hyalospora FSU 10163]